jgi:hypothetical protein
MARTAATIGSIIVAIKPLIADLHRAMPAH